ncbi:hypothetical protein LX32DRAFT_156635 [Colletotrichum zoysiae]|uniref:Uncharacterized protein n=1 Tax=Colletotrichum zoysiae TaxID=1216348 RepID=A0AAD9HR88_9PEZI|nr:hypothetical protein LX32DRAFT_156635 [Colletotrichum zoysiae]
MAPVTLMSRLIRFLELLPAWRAFHATLPFRVSPPPISYPARAHRNEAIAAYIPSLLAPGLVRSTPWNWSRPWPRLLDQPVVKSPRMEVAGRNCAHARPMPEPRPVMTATLPSPTGSMAAGGMKRAPEEVAKNMFPFESLLAVARPHQRRRKGGTKRRQHGQDNSDSVYVRYSYVSKPGCCLASRPSSPFSVTRPGGRRQRELGKGHRCEENHLINCQANHENALPRTIR